MTDQPVLPGGDYHSVTNELINFTGPAAPGLKVLSLIANTMQQQEQAQRQILEAWEKQLNAKIPAYGFTSDRISYAPGDRPEQPGGVMVIDLSSRQKVRPAYFSFVTFPTGAEANNPWSKNIYGAFGRTLIKGPEFAPRNYDFIISSGGKIQKYNIRQGMEAITLWSETSFDAVLYATPGNADELPSF